MSFCKTSFSTTSIFSQLYKMKIQKFVAYDEQLKLTRPIKKKLL